MRPSLILKVFAVALLAALVGDPGVAHAGFCTSLADCVRGDLTTGVLTLIGLSTLTGVVLLGTMDGGFNPPGGEEEQVFGPEGYTGVKGGDLTDSRGPKFTFTPAPGATPGEIAELEKEAYGVGGGDAGGERGAPPSGAGFDGEAPIRSGGDGRRPVPEDDSGFDPRGPNFTFTPAPGATPEQIAELEKEAYGNRLAGKSLLMESAVDAAAAGDAIEDELEAEEEEQQEVEGEEEDEEDLGFDVVEDEPKEPESIEDYLGIQPGDFSPDPDAPAADKKAETPTTTKEPESIEDYLGIQPGDFSPDPDAPAAKPKEIDFSDAEKPSRLGPDGKPMSFEDERYADEIEGGRPGSETMDPELRKLLDRMKAKDPTAKADYQAYLEKMRNSEPGKWEIAKQFGRNLVGADQPDALTAKGTALSGTRQIGDELVKQGKGQIENVENIGKAAGVIGDLVQTKAGREELEKAWYENFMAEAATMAPDLFKGLSAEEMKGHAAQLWEKAKLLVKDPDKFQEVAAKGTGNVITQVLMAKGAQALGGLGGAAGAADGIAAGEAGAVEGGMAGEIGAVKPGVPTPKPGVSAGGAVAGEGEALAGGVKPKAPVVETPAPGAKPAAPEVGAGGQSSFSPEGPTQVKVNQGAQTLPESPAAPARPVAPEPTGQGSFSPDGPTQVKVNQGAQTLPESPAAPARPVAPEPAGQGGFSPDGPTQVKVNQGAKTLPETPAAPAEPSASQVGPGGRTSPTSDLPTQGPGPGAKPAAAPEAAPGGQRPGQGGQAAPADPNATQPTKVAGFGEEPGAPVSPEGATAPGEPPAAPEVGPIGEGPLHYSANPLKTAAAKIRGAMNQVDLVRNTGVRPGDAQIVFKNYQQAVADAQAYMNNPTAVARATTADLRDIADLLRRPKTLADIEALIKK